MRLALGPLLVTIKYTYPRGRTTIYQRAVPTDLRNRYGSATIKHVLKTVDPVQVARLVSDLNRRIEADWEALRAAPDSSPRSLKTHADEFLRRWGLEPNAPDNDPMAIELLHDHIERKRAHYAAGDEEVYRNAPDSEFLTPVEVEAGRRLHGKQSVTLSDALDQYLSIHPQRDNARFVGYQRDAFAGLIAICGDREIDSFQKADARRYMDTALLKLKTTTVRRRMGVFSAVFASYISENNLLRPNPFAAIPIPREGHDATRREPFTATELATLEAACRKADDPMRWILALLAGTGARLAEVVGLLLEDIKEYAAVPHVLLQVHPWRDIKGAKGIRGVKDRTVPLVGPALWAAQRLKATAVDTQRFAFPQYTNEAVCKATSASGALNGWIRRLPLEHTCHELRHTVKDLLRDVQCPKDIADAITGHGKKDTGDGYGHGHNLRVKQEWLAKALADAVDRE